MDEKLLVKGKCNTDRTLPGTRRCLFIGLHGSSGDKIAPLGNVFLSLLPPDLNLLLLATFSEVVLFEGFRLIIYDRTCQEIVCGKKVERETHAPYD